MTESRVTFAVVEDNATQRRNLVAALAAEPSFDCLGEFPDAESALLALPKLTPDVVLVDIKLPGMNGVDCVRRLTRELPETMMLMLTVCDDSELVFESLAGGAIGYLLKPVKAEMLRDAVKEVLAGGAPMSMSIARQVVRTFQKPADEPAAAAAYQLRPREAEILELLAKGLLKKEIAAKLGISYWTVQTHVTRIYRKLQVRTRSQAVAKLHGL
jgi:DNA-binding NarL/FixJ family response regulator